MTGFLNHIKYLSLLKWMGIKNGNVGDIIQAFPEDLMTSVWKQWLCVLIIQ